MKVYKILNSATTLYFQYLYDCDQSRYTGSKAHTYFIVSDQIEESIGIKRVCGYIYLGCKMFICIASILQGSPPNTPVAKEMAKVSPLTNLTIKYKYQNTNY